MKFRSDNFKALFKKRSIPGWILFAFSFLWRRLADWQNIEWLGKHAVPKTWPKTVPHPNYVTMTLFFTGLAWFTAILFWPRKGSDQSGKTMPPVDKPELYLDYSTPSSAHLLNHSGLTVRNCGKKPAFKVNLNCHESARLRLRLDGLPIQRIDPDKSALVDLWTECLADDGRWIPIGGMRGVQIEELFARLEDTNEEEKISVDIAYSDYEGRHFSTPCIILRDGIIFLTKRIWCELVQGPRC